MKVRIIGFVSILSFLMSLGEAKGETLLGLCDKAMSVDPVLGIAKSDVAIAEAKASIARSALSAQVVGRVGRSRAYSTAESYSELAKINVSQVILDGAARGELVRSNDLHRVASLRFEQSKSDAIIRVAEAYFGLLVEIESLEALRAAEMASKAQVAYTQRKIESGLAPITDLHEAQARLESLRADIQRGQVAKADAVQAIFEITGQVVDSVHGLGRVTSSEPTPATAIEAPKRQPARLLALKAGLDAANAEVDMSRARYMPSVKIAGSRSFDRIAGHEVADHANPGYALTAAMSIPVFSGGMVSSTLRQAVAKRNIAQAKLEREGRSVTRSVERAKADLLASETLMEARESAVLSSRFAYEASIAGQEVGIRTPLDVLENQARLLESQLSLARARYEKLKQGLVLENAQGTLTRATIERLNKLLVRRHVIR